MTVCENVVSFKQFSGVGVIKISNPIGFSRSPSLDVLLATKIIQMAWLLFSWKSFIFFALYSKHLK